MINFPGAEEFRKLENKLFFLDIRENEKNIEESS